MNDEFHRLAYANLKAKQRALMAKVLGIRPSHASSLYPHLAPEAPAQPQAGRSAATLADRLYPTPKKEK